jgi:hypothetical protein
MTDKTTEVWVPECRGVLFYADLSEVSKDHAWRSLSRRTLEDAAGLRSRGWTVRPATLTIKDEP